MSILKRLTHDAKVKPEPAEVFIKRVQVDALVEEILHSAKVVDSLFLFQCVRSNLLLGRVKVLGVPIQVIGDDYAAHEQRQLDHGEHAKAIRQ